MFRVRLKELREDMGISQYEFADRLGVAQSTVGGWESGKREPNFDTMQKIANFFGVTVDYLLGRTDVKTPIGPTLDDEANELLEELHKRPEMKVLFSVSRKATREDIERAVKIIEALKGSEED